MDADPANPSFLGSLGWAYFKLGHLDKAQRHIAESLRLDASSSPRHERIGDVYARQGKPEEARAAWSKALSLAPDAGTTDRLKGKLGGKAKE